MSFRLRAPVALLLICSVVCVAVGFASPPSGAVGRARAAASRIGDLLCDRFLGDKKPRLVDTG